MHPVIVVGGGISGIACARALHEAGVAVQVLDRGRRLGGRMASRTVAGRPVDTGASYFTASDPAFEAVVEDWRDRGLARPWTDTFDVVGSEATSGPMRWGSTTGFRALVEDLAAGLDVRTEVTVEAVRRADPLEVDGRPAAAVLLAMPDPQASRLLTDDLRATLPAPVGFEPVLALVAGWPKRHWSFDGLFVDEDPVLAWIADDGRRRGDDAPMLVAHSTTGFAADHLADPAAAEPALVEALLRVLEVSEPPSTTLVHRWSFARPTSPRDEPYALTTDGVGLCGDAWGGKPRVEAAYLSGRALGIALVDRLA
jgi:renalase